MPKDKKMMKEMAMEKDMKGKKPKKGDLTIAIAIGKKKPMSKMCAMKKSK